MGCLSLNGQIGPPPPIPPILSSPLDFTIKFPPFAPPGQILCCHFELPMFTIPIAIPAPIPPAVWTVLNALIAAALLVLPEIQLPSCSKDSIS